MTCIIKRNMPKKWFSLFLGLFALSQVTSSPSSGELFTSSFLVRFKRSVDNHQAHEIAKRNGFHNIGAVSSIFLTFMFSFILNNLRRFIKHPNLSYLSPKTISSCFMLLVFSYHHTIPRATSQFAPNVSRLKMWIITLYLRIHEC